MLQVHAENMCTFWHDIPGITYWIPGICLFEYRGLNQAGGRGGPCWKLILFTLQRSLQYVICLLRYRGELLFCLIDNMLDGKLWLFPSRQEKEEEISSPVSFDLQTLHISPCTWQIFYCHFFRCEQLCRCACLFSHEDRIYYAWHSRLHYTHDTNTKLRRKKLYNLNLYCNTIL